MLEQKDLEMIASMLKPITDNLEELNKKVTSIQITLENDTNAKIDIIGEGHDFLKERLSEALQMEQKREQMELELINLRMEIRKLKEHLEIA